MLLASFVLNAILCSCGILLYEFYMRLSRMINNVAFYHSDHSRRNIKIRLTAEYPATIV